MSRAPYKRMKAAAAKALLVCRLQVFLESWGAWTLALLCGGGAAALALRLLSAPDILPPILIAALSCASLIIALAALGRLKLDESDIAAWLDKESKGDGFVMMCLKEGDGCGWDESAKGISMPKVRGRALKPMLSGFAGVAFAMICLNVGLPQSVVRSIPKKLEVKAHTEGLRERIEALEDAHVIDQQTGERFERLLKELEQNRDAYEPGKVFDTLDTIDSAIRNLGDSAAKGMMETSKKMEGLEMATESLGVSPDAAKERELRKMAEELSKQMCSSKECGMEMKGGLDPNKALSDLLSSPPPPDPEKLKKMAEALKQCQNGLKDGMKKLSESGATKEQAEALKKFLEQNEGNRMSSGEGSEMHLTKEQLEAMKNGQCPGCGEGEGLGLGGITRGRGDAPMIFSPTDTKRAEGGIRERLKSESLNMKLGEGLGVSFAAPDAKPIDDGGQGALSTGVGSGGQARTQRISPKDRAAVKKFFSNSASN